jgi:predicted ATPase
MIQFKTTLEFEPEQLVESMGTGEARALRRVGFATREEAQASIVPGNMASRPGQPPHDKTGTLKRFILYEFDKSTGSVVMGAKLLRRKSKDVVTALEYGGRSVTAQAKQITVERRPFMQPAFNKAIRNTVPTAFQDCIR